MKRKREPMEVCDICRGDIERSNTLNIPLIQTTYPEYSTGVREVVVCEKCREAIAVAIKKAIGVPYWVELDEWIERRQKDGRPLNEKISDLFEDKKA